VPMSNTEVANLQTDQPEPSLPSFQVLKNEDLKIVLSHELTRRIASNPKYSLRAFAKYLKMSPSMLSMVIAGHAFLSDKSAQRVVKKLGFLLKSPSKPTAELSSSAGETDSEATNLSTVNVDLEIFMIFSQWYHFAILSLLEIEGASLSPKWVSHKLGITEIEARIAVDRLKSLNIIEKENGKWRQAHGPIRISGGVANAASRQFQKSLIKRALAAIDEGTPEVRDISSMTFAMDRKHFPVAVKKIETFRRSLTEFLERKSKPTDVYNLTIQLVPVTPEPTDATKRKVTNKLNKTLKGAKTC